MADSTEDLKREFEEFEKNEEASDAALDQVTVAESTAPRSQTPDAPAQRKMPSWIIWMVVADVIIAAIVIAVVAA